MVKSYSYNWHSIKNTKDLTMKQMFDVSETLISAQSDDIHGVKTINWEDYSLKYLSLIGDEHVISLLHTKVCVFSDSVLCLGKIHGNLQSNTAWEERLAWFKSSQEYKDLDRIDDEPIEFEWIISEDSPHCSSVTKFRISCWDWVNFTGRNNFMSMFNDISWGSKDNKKECESNAQLVSLFAKSFGTWQWLFLGPGSEKKWYSTHVDRPQGDWGRVAELMMNKFGESGHPIFWATIPLSRGVLKSKGGGKLSIHYCADPGTITTVFRRTITSANQLSLYGTVEEMYEECESCPDRTGGPDCGRAIESIVRAKCVQDKHTFWMMILHKKNFSCKDFETELKSNHNKTDWANFVLMQDSWLQLKSDSTSWRKTLENSHNLEIQWLVVSAFCQERKIIWPERLDSREHRNWARVTSDNQLPTR